MATTPTTPEVAHDLLRRRQANLDVFFCPQTIAVIGATENPGAVGRTVLWNLISNPFGGTVFPVNPKRDSVLGIKAYPNIAAVPSRVDLAVLVTPAPSVPGLIGECVDAGVRGAIIISAGFREAGPDGHRLEQQVREQLARGSMRVIGPNCLGVMSPPTGVNATFAAGMARSGGVGFLSQSGALLTAILDWSQQEQIGFSAFVSLGSMLDVGWGDLIDYLGNDPRTSSIVIYMESIGDARSFLSAAREVAFRKPIIVIKAGRSEQASHAAASHTGSLTGSDAVLDAAFRRSGVLRVESIADLFHMADVLARQPRPKGPRITILTNAGGPAVLATDALIAEQGQLAELSPATLDALNGVLPPHWSHGNPVDILGDAPPERYAKAVELAASDPNSDGLLVVLTPQAMTDPTQTAEKLKPHARLPGKPILASWMGGSRVAAGRAILSAAGIPNFPYPDSAARMFQYMWRYTDHLRSLYETPSLPRDAGDPAASTAQAAALLSAIRTSGRTLLDEVESKQLLACYGIPTVPTETARTAAEAQALAERLGFPVVLKVYSRTITHKTDVGGVQLDLGTRAEVARAYAAIEDAVTRRAGREQFEGVTVQPMVRLPEATELILGSSVDPQFGPVLLFGAGGQLVEVLKDRALALPPLTSTLARRLIGETRVAQVLRGVRGRAPVDETALAQLLVRFSQLIVEHPAVKELDINPLLASGEGLLALDARVLLHPPTIADADLPRPAIRPYPAQYTSRWTLPDGTELIIRPIRPEDEPALVRFHYTLSEQSVYSRYFQTLQLSQRVAHDRLARLCFIDYDRELALVAQRDGADGTPELVAVARYVCAHGTRDAEFALLVSDTVQRSGVGTELSRRLLAAARAEGLRRITAEILADNIGMQKLCRKLGFELTQPDPQSEFHAWLDL